MRAGRACADEAGAIDATAHYMAAIEQIGFRDPVAASVYPLAQYRLSTRGNRSRIDHAFLAHDLAASVGIICYSHEERIAGSPITRP